jgi:FAD/FMN-containing dehydrogenase
MAAVHPWYALIEMAVAPFIAVETTQAFQRLLEDFLQRGQLRDAVIANSGAQRDDFWRLREGIPQAQTRFGRSLKHDISLPIGAIPGFVRTVVGAVLEIEPTLLPISYGHLGDGNLHFNFSVPQQLAAPSFAALAAQIQRLVHSEAARCGGSFSAEHGIGRLKVAELERYEDGVSLQIMRDLKRALDPQSIMNPGKVLRS